MASVHSYLNQFDATTLDLQPANDNPAISYDITQTLARCLAWDDQNEVWRPVLLDKNGRLIVSSSYSGNETVDVTTVTVTTNNDIIAEARFARTYIQITNDDDGDLYISFVDATDATKRFTMRPQTVLTITDYNGIIYGTKHTSNITLGIIERYVTSN